MRLINNPNNLCNPLSRARLPAEPVGSSRASGSLRKYGGETEEVIGDRRPTPSVSGLHLSDTSSPTSYRPFLLNICPASREHKAATLASPPPPPGPQENTINCVHLLCMIFCVSVASFILSAYQSSAGCSGARRQRRRAMAGGNRRTQMHNKAK